MQIKKIVDPGPRQEDYYLAKDNIFGVFDGANSTNRYFGSDGRSGGQIAAQIARDAFALNDRSLKELARKANQKIRKALLKAKIDMSDKLNLWVTAFAVMRLHQKYFEWLQISDCQIIIIYKDGTYKTLIQDYDHDSKALLEWKKFAQKKIKNIRDLIDADALKRIRREANVSWGVLNGEKGYLKFLNFGKENLKDIDHIILCTDGLFIPKKDPKAADDFDTFVKFYLKGGLKKIKDYVRKIQDQDPYCWKYPRYKQYDDLAAVSIEI